MTFLFSIYLHVNCCHWELREDEIRGFRTRPVEKHVNLELDGSQKDEQNKKEKELKEKRRNKNKPKGPKP